jgi:hypothetical protein
VGFRVLRPGGFLVGSDTLASTGLHDFHAGDIYNPIEPSSLLVKLQTIAFAEVTVAIAHDLRFAARKAVDELVP